MGIEPWLLWAGSERAFYLAQAWGKLGAWNDLLGVELREDGKLAFKEGQVFPNTYIDACGAPDTNFRRTNAAIVAQRTVSAIADVSDKVCPRHVPTSSLPKRRDRIRPNFSYVLAGSVHFEHVVQVSMREDMTALIFAFDAMDQACFDGSRGRLHVCVPRTHPCSVFSCNKWAHVVETQAPLAAAVELFLGGADVPLCLLCVTTTCLHASLRQSLATAESLADGEHSISDVLTMLCPVARGAAGDGDVATAEMAIGTFSLNLTPASAGTIMLFLLVLLCRGN